MVHLSPTSWSAPAIGHPSILRRRNSSPSITLQRAWRRLNHRKSIIRSPSPFGEGVTYKFMAHSFRFLPPASRLPLPVDCLPSPVSLVAGAETELPRESNACWPEASLSDRCQHRFLPPAACRMTARECSLRP